MLTTLETAPCQSQSPETLRQWTPSSHSSPRACFLAIVSYSRISLFCQSNSPSFSLSLFILIPQMTQSSNCLIRCCKILHCIWNTVVLTVSALHFFVYVMATALLLLQQGNYWSPFPPQFYPDLESRRIFLQSLFPLAVLACIQSYNAIIGLSSPIRLSISNSIVLSYFIYPAVYYLETGDSRHTIIAYCILTVVYTLSSSVARSVKKEILNRADYSWWVHQRRI